MAAMSESGLATPQPAGDVAVTIRVSGASPAETLGRVRCLAEAVQAMAIPGVTDVIAAPGRVTVAYDPLVVANLAALSGSLAAAHAEARDQTGGDSPRHEIPVAYDGPDLDHVCSLHGLGRDALVAAHTGPEYLVEAIGFLPGFGYLTGLPAGLATPRRATPRRLVPAGSVGIGGHQTGVYPCPSPGGWNLVGRSDVRLFDAARSKPALLAVGDRVRFVAAELPPADAAAEAPALVGGAGPAAITVIQPGLFTTIQDLGRPGLRSAGVPLSGAADRVSLRVANLLVGNPADAAAIECTLVGPTLRFEREAVVALGGAMFPGFSAGVAVRVAAGAEIPLGHATAGCRGYLAVAGGIDVPAALGSRSTLVAAGLGGLGGRPLRAGDRLAVGNGRLPTRTATGAIRAADLKSAGFGALASRDRPPAVLRIIPAGQAEIFGGAAWERRFRASSRSDRMGLRLEGEALPGATAGGSMASVAVFPGTVQVPPDGQPILLLADAQTIGGYPLLGQVIAADLPRAAQLRPGDEVRFAPASIGEAHAAQRNQEAAVAAFGESLR